MLGQKTTKRVIKNTVILCVLIVGALSSLSLLLQGLALIVLGGDEEPMLMVFRNISIGCFIITLLYIILIIRKWRIEYRIRDDIKTLNFMNDSVVWGIEERIAKLW